MSKKDTQFKGSGKGISGKIDPICARFPQEIDHLLRTKIDDLSEYVRNAVITQLKKDKLL